MDPTGNFYNYRTALRGAAHRSLTAHSNREKVGRMEVTIMCVCVLCVHTQYFQKSDCSNIGQNAGKLVTEACLRNACHVQLLTTLWERSSMVPIFVSEVGGHRNNVVLIILPYLWNSFPCTYLSGICSFSVLGPEWSFFFIFPICQ